MIAMAVGKLPPRTTKASLLTFRRYVLHRSSDQGIKIYFWSRSDYTVPLELRFPRGRIRPDYTWGIPQAVFPFTEDCSPDHFNAHQIIFDLTFCVSAFTQISSIRRSGLLCRVILLALYILPLAVPDNVTLV